MRLQSFSAVAAVFTLQLCVSVACAPLLAAAAEPAPQNKTVEHTKPIQHMALKEHGKKETVKKTLAKKGAPLKKDLALKDKKSDVTRAAEVEPSAGGDAALVVTDTDETALLPAYPVGAPTSIGKMDVYRTQDEDTLLDIARHFRLGFVQLRAANPDFDAWSPLPDTEVVLPTFRLLPRAKQEGVVVNLAEMRMYYYRTAGASPETFPIGIGRDGLQTPTGETTIVRKVADPVWHPTDRMRKEKDWLPETVPAGPANPLGTHAFYLGWPEVLIHGSNKPWAIGRRVSSGCMRMYPEDIKHLYNVVPVGTKLTVVDQPLLVAWVGDKLYFEANPSKTQSSDIEIEGSFTPHDLNDSVKAMIIAAAGKQAEGKINWDKVKTVLHERRGYPIEIADRNKKYIPTKDVKPVKETVAKKSVKPTATSVRVRPAYNE